MVSRQELIDSVQCIIDRTRHCIFRAQNRKELYVIVALLTDYISGLNDLIYRLKNIDTDSDLDSLLQVVLNVNSRLIDLERVL